LTHCRATQFRNRGPSGSKPSGCFTTHSLFLRTYTHIQPSKIRATLTRFYMLTNMTLSAATPANRRSDQGRRSSRSWRYRRPERTKRAEGALSPTVLIYGSAIKTSANQPKFNNMQFSNRRQTGGLTIASPRLLGRSAMADYSSQPWLFTAPGATLFAPHRTRQTSPRAPK
jgi:hypothetical protein